MEVALYRFLISGLDFSAGRAFAEVGADFGDDA
jgi:hypothetical protein